MITIKQGHLYDHPEFGRVIATKNYTGHGVEMMECISVPDDYGHGMDGKIKMVFPFINELVPMPMRYFGETEQKNVSGNK
jgi:hypothetical protein